MIEANGLCFSYGKAPILKDLDLQFEPGRLYAVVGPNGSGKTTFLKLLSRLAQPQKGQLTLDGRPYRSFGRKEFARQLALLPQGRNIPNSSVYDLVACARFPYLDLSRNLTQEDHAAVLSALQAAGVEGFAERNLKKLSGGERQRVYIAMLYAQQASYVLLDEPTTHLDIAAKLQTMELLIQMKHAGKCVIAVLHDLDLALKFADELLLLCPGGSAVIGPPQQITAGSALEEAFHVSCQEGWLEGRKTYLFDLI